VGNQTNDIPSGWTRASIEQVGAVRLGVQRSPSRQTGRFPTKYVRAANITPNGIDVSDLLEMDFTPAERETYILRNGDVLLTEASGSASQVGRAAIWRDQVPGSCFQNTVIRFRPHAVLPEFAHVVFRHYAAQGVFAQTARGVGIQHLGGKRFATLPFPVPPLEEQQRIAAETDRRTIALKEAEAALRSALDRVEEQDREILASAVTGRLVEQESVLAKGEGRTFVPAIETLHRVIHSSAGKQGSILPTESVPELPSDELLPDGWVWARLGGLGEARLGKQLSPNEERGPNQNLYLRVANVFEDRIDLHDVKRMHFSNTEHEVYRLKKDDILLNEGQSIELVGRPAMFKDDLPDVCFQNTLIRFRSGAAIVPEYALLVFRHFLHSGEFRKIARRSTNIAHLGLERFADLPLPLPPPNEQHRIIKEAHHRLDASRAQRLAVRASLDRLPELERELLVAAISGALVPQDPGAETATALLARIGPPPERVATVVSAGMSVMSTTKRQDPVPRHSTSTLRQVLTEAGRPLRVPELFSMSDYDRDSTEDVERFYLKLRAELGTTIRIIGKTDETALLEAIPDASQ
jgi:Type I restriction modification DNA specificity domain